MGLYIHMEMPTNNDMNPTAVLVYPNGYAIVFKDNGKMKQYTEAVSVPEPHGDLIDRDALFKKCEFVCTDDDEDIRAVRYSILENAPTIIPAEPPKEEE